MDFVPLHADERNIIDHTKRAFMMTTAPIIVDAP
jgi:hypothetical protein